MISFEVYFIDVTCFCDILGCSLDSNYFMPATLLLDCLRALGSTGTRQIEYIETTYDQGDPYLNKVCNAINPRLVYDKSLTEAHPRACEKSRKAWMYPSNTKLGWLSEGYYNGCGHKQIYHGFYCKVKLKK